MLNVHCHNKNRQNHRHFPILVIIKSLVVMYSWCEHNKIHDRESWQMLSDIWADNDANSTFADKPFLNSISLFSVLPFLKACEWSTSACILCEKILNCSLLLYQLLYNVPCRNCWWKKGGIEFRSSSMLSDKISIFMKLKCDVADLLWGNSPRQLIQFPDYMRNSYALHWNENRIVEIYINNINKLILIMTDVSISISIRLFLLTSLAEINQCVIGNALW